MLTVTSMAKLFEAMFFVILILTYFYAGVAFQVLNTTQSAVAVAAPALPLSVPIPAAAVLAASAAQSAPVKANAYGNTTTTTALEVAVAVATECGDWCPGFGTFGLSILTYFQVCSHSDSQTK